jgi:hypothetical protein
MTRASLFLLTLILIPTVGSAQNPIVEIGAGLGATATSGEGSSLTGIGVSDQGARFHPTLYASFFAGDALVIEPQFGLAVGSSEGETTTGVYLGGDIGHLFSGPEVSSFLLAGNLGFRSTEESGSDFAVGGKVGYRIPIGTGVALRLEGGYRRWLDSGQNQFRFSIGIGGIIRGSR